MQAYKAFQTTHIKILVVSWVEAGRVEVIGFVIVLLHIHPNLALFSVEEVARPGVGLERD